MQLMEDSISSQGVSVWVVAEPCLLVHSCLAGHVLWREPIFTGVLNPKVPEAPELQPLNLDAYRMGFWYAVITATGHDGSVANPGLLRALALARANMKVTFLLFGCQEDMEKKRWELSASTKLISETRVLRGYKKVLGVTQLRNQLVLWQRGSSDRDVTWLQL